VKLEWSAAALVDRRNAFTYVELDNPRAAAVLDTRIVAQVIRLLDFPYSGRSGVVTGTRELPIGGTAYLAVYSVSEDAVLILRVLHAAQAWPEQDQ
jgi:addiction module RelE/StbE family toxin